MQFICDRQRLLTMACPVTANLLWRQAFAAGCQASRQQQWQDAYMAYGAAFDIACILLQQQLPAPPAYQLQWQLQLSCQNLTLVLRRLGRYDEADKYLTRFHHWLCDSSDHDLNSPAAALH